MSDLRDNMSDLQEQLKEERRLAEEAVSELEAKLEEQRELEKEADLKLKAANDELLKANAEDRKQRELDIIQAEKERSE